MQLINWFKDMGMAGIFDVVIMTLLIYMILVWFKRTRAAFVLTGIFIVSSVYLIARLLNLTLAAAIFERFFAVILIAVVVIFQEEIRQFFEKIAVWSLNRRLAISRKNQSIVSREEVDILVRALTDMARQKIGALVVVKGRDLLGRYLEGGAELNGQLSEPLVKSIFDPHSIGHDGALVLEGSLVTRFSVRLPLSKNVSKIGWGGTRHAAALGLSEFTDALCIVVSEERGTISVAENGDMKELSEPEKLGKRLEGYFNRIYPRNSKQFWVEFYTQNTWEKILAFFMALALWTVLVQGDKLTYRTLSVPVQYDQLQSPYVVKSVQPEYIDITFRGKRGDFVFSRRDSVKVFIKLEPKEGTQTIRLVRDNVVYPKELDLEALGTRRVEVSIVRQVEPTPVPTPEARPSPTMPRR